MAELEIVGGIKQHYTMIPNEVARAKDISPRALKVYVYLRSHQPGFRVNVRGIATNLGMGKNSVNDAVRELEELGYVERVWVTPEGSNLRSGIKYRIFESRRTSNGDTGVPDSGNPNFGNPKTGTHKEDYSFKKTNDLKEDYGASRIAGDFYPKNFDALAKKYPSLDLESVLDEFKDYWLSNTTAKAKKKDWDRTFAVWCSRQKPKRMTREQKSEQMRKWKEEILAESQNEEKEEVPF